jgi:CheY-like chemotaxis protein/anti-sigma regulatory factor (Ser/Thr protein kinase)
MSHEIRTPLTAIMGFTDILRKRIEDPETFEILEVIKRNALFLLNIVNEILDLAKVEAGRLTVSMTPYFPRDLVEDLVSSMSLRAKRKELPIMLDFASEVPEALIGDPTRLRQILLNLLGNAIKFTNEGHIAIKVGFTDGEDARLRFEVSDTGIGMSETEQKMIFEAFSQGDGSVTRRYGGTGLGLAISRRLVDKLGGTLSVESELGKGSAFVVELPVEVSTQGGDEILHEIEKDGAQKSFKRPTGTRRDLRVLVVDDNEGIREIVSLFLASTAAVVEAASSGLEAIEKVEGAARADEPFDVIVMDMQMPGLDGYEATRRLRESGFDKPIIALTAAAMHGDKERCLAAGCTGYLTKPFEPDELIESVVGQSVISLDE